MNFALKFSGFLLRFASLILPRLAGKWAFLAFCYPFAPPLRDYQLQFLEAGKSGRLPLKKKEIQLYRWGRGEEIVLLLHGWRSNSFRWKTLVESDAARAFTFFAIDAPGHGLSEGKINNVPIYAEAISTAIEKIGRVDHIVAHSIGGFALLHCLYVNDGFRPKRTVIMGSPTHAEEFVEFFKEQLGVGDRVERCLRQYFESSTGKKVSDFNTPKYVSDMELEGLIIHDPSDEVVPYRHSEELHASWRGSTLHTTSGLGHSLKDEALDRLICRYLDQGFTHSN